MRRAWLDFADMPTPTPFPTTVEGFSESVSVNGRDAGRVFHCREVTQGLAADARK